jgi:transcription termination factor Rho
MRNTNHRTMAAPRPATPQQPAKGLLEYQGRNGGYVRPVSFELSTSPSDPFIPAHIIARSKLREGSLIECTVRRDGRGNQADAITSVNGMPLASWMAVEDFQRRTAIDPHEALNLTSGAGDASMRVVDLMCPIGKGQRALIVAPPRSGKTVLMQKIAHSISQNHPEVDLLVLLVDERPEEVTDMRRNVKGMVFASSSDSDRESHVRLAKLVLESAKRTTETGRDVVILLDSLTKMGRAFNAVQRGSGKTLSGGVDSRALEVPKRIFGAARALEGGGTLTIIATALVGTNSRMDDLIFEEFKGTGNMELVLDRDLSNERIFPAIDITASGTRREELLFGANAGLHQSLRRLLSRMKPKEAMLSLLGLIEKYPTNRSLLNAIAHNRIEV